MKCTYKDFQESLNGFLGDTKTVSYKIVFLMQILPLHF